jgi:hypothetical protein
MTKFSDLPFDFQIGNRHQATGDRPVLLYNPKNDKLLFDVDGAGGDKAKKIGKITADLDPMMVDALPMILEDVDFVFGNRNAATEPNTTLILNLKNGNLLLDMDGVGGDKAIKIGHLDLDF